MRRLLDTRFLSGILALALAGLGGVRSQRLSLQSLSEGLGAAFFPWMVLVAMAMLGFALIGVGLFGQDNLEDRPSLPGVRILPILGIAGSLLAYALLLVPLGFLAATAGFLLTTALILRARPLPAGIFALLTTTGLWAVFGLALRVPLP